MKRILAMLLACAMLFGLGVNAFADDAEDETEQAKAIVRLKIVGNTQYYWVDQTPASRGVPNPWGGAISTSQPDTKTIYFPHPQTISGCSIKLQKGEGASYVKSVSEKYRELEEPFFAVSGSGKTWSPAGTTGFIAVELKDDKADKEFTMTFKITVTAEKDVKLYQKGSSKPVTMKKGTKVTVESPPLLVNNELLDLNRTTPVGMSTEKSSAVRGVKEGKQVSWASEEKTLATLVLPQEAKGGYPKLSGNWDSSGRGGAFPKKDVYVYAFATSKSLDESGTLKLANPFIDANGEQACKAEAIKIYQLRSGKYREVTKSFSYNAETGFFSGKASTLNEFVLTAPQGTVEKTKD